MVMKGKRGQFFLVGAIVIITVLVGFSVVSNYSRNKEVVKLYDLKQELGIESARVLEYGTYETVTGDEIQGLLLNFSSDYADYAGEGKNLYFVFGNIQKVTAVAYQDMSADKITIVIKEGGKILGEGEIGGEGKAGVPVEFPISSTGAVKIIINIAAEEYSFRLRTGENFYFVIEQIIGEERYVVSG